MSISWFYSVVLHPRDEQGRLIRSKKRPDRGGSGWPERDVFFKLWRGRRLREDLIEKKWAEVMRRHAERLRGEG